MKLKNLDLSFIREKTFYYRKKCSNSEFEIASNEFKKFLKLVKKGNTPLAIPSKKVDDIWHSFLLFTKEYRIFCQDNFGFFVDHQPNTDTSPVPLSAISNFYIEYEKAFGEIKEIWYEDFDSKTVAQLMKKEVPESFSQQYKWSGWPGLKR